MLPDTQHLPALRLKPLSVLGIPFGIASELLCPEVPVVLRYRRMLRAPMPETAINEHGQLRADKDHVGARPTDPILQPVTQAKRPDFSPQAQLRSRVTPLDAGHHLTASVRNFEARHMSISGTQFSQAVACALSSDVQFPIKHLDAAS